MSPSGLSVASWKWTAIAGVVLGAIGVLADWVGNGYDWDGRPALQLGAYLVLAILGNAGGGWLLLAVVVAYFAERGRGTVAAIIAGASFLCVGVAVYYILNIGFGIRHPSPALWKAFGVWMLGALVAGAIAGLAASWLKSGRGITQTVGAIVVFAAVAFDGALILRGIGSGDEHLTPVLFVMGLYTGIVIGLAYRAVRSWRPLVMAIAIAVPVVFLARGVLIDLINF